MSIRAICIVVPILFLLLFVGHAYGESVEHIQMRVGEQISIPAEGVEKYSEGQKGVVDIRLPEDGLEFIVVGVRPGTSTLLLIKAGGIKERYQFEVKALDTAVPARENIRLDFYFVELSESSQYQVGVAWPGSIGVEMSLELAIDATGVTAGAASLTGLPLPRLDALHRTDWARIARQASIITANGEQASYDSGGEVNIAIEGALVAELRQIAFGTKLNVLPRYDHESGRLEVRVQAEVSSLGEGRVPSRTRSSINTVVNVGMNQAIVLAGLYAKSTSKNKAGLPFLSQLPVIGTLFGSHGKRSERVQNVVFIVPSIVDVVDMDARAQIDDALRAYERFSGDMDDITIAPRVGSRAGE